MILGILKEIYSGERRVAIAPSGVKQCKKNGHTIIIEKDAGLIANFPDEQYKDSGAEICESAREVWEKSDLIIKIRPPLESIENGENEIEFLRKDLCLICMLNPVRKSDNLKQLAKTGSTVIAVDQIPRISRAQSMDVLSSMANISGYRAVTEAAHNFGRLFTGQITAAGRIPPAKVLVIGAGVAGLSAIGSAQSLGAIVRAFDIRQGVREEVKSMGAEYLELDIVEDGSGEGGYGKSMSKEFLDAEMKLFSEQAKEVNIIITTAAIPGKKSPILITKEMVESMIPGSVIVDLAAEGGGNCELTKPGEFVRYKKVTIIGFTDLPSRLPTQASQLFSNNVTKLIQHLTEDGKIKLDFQDEITDAITVVHAGKVRLKSNKQKTSNEKLTEVKKIKNQTEYVSKKNNIENRKNLGWFKILSMSLMVVLLVLIGFFGSSELLSHITVFILSCFVGYMVVWNVSPSLHTPLMSVTNAISGIIVIGGIINLSEGQIILSSIAIFIATINIVGGFFVTKRMLEMFKK